MSAGEPTPGAHDCGGDAAAYVLGALEPAEAEAYRRHLEQCAVCRDEVEALEGVVGALPMAAPQVAAPQGLRRRVMRAVREEPRRAARREPRRRPALVSVWTARPAVGALAAAAVVALAVLGGLTLAGGGSGGRLIQAQVVGIPGSAQLRVHRDRGELIVRRLPQPPQGHVYEVWLKPRGAAPVPASVLFSVNSNGAADVGIPHALNGISAVMVTPEPDGGSPAPTHSPVIVAAL